jgi:anti-sigma regulatory factor (Ser/Thr protein kinase)
MSSDLDLSVPATTRGLRDALQALAAVCRDDHLLSRGRIVVEELFTNTMKYGYGGESERPVRLSFRVERGLTVVIEDEAPGFDPTAWVAPPGPAERVGQAGIAMVLGLSERVEYSALANGNRVTVTIR